MSTATFDVSNAMSTVTLRVTGLRTLRVRTWLAAQVFKLGALIAGCNITIDSDGE